MKKELIIGIIVVAIILVAILSFTFIKDNSNLSQNEQIEKIKIEPEIKQEEPISQPPLEIVQQEYTIEITGTGFNPKTIEINKGDKVNFVNVGTSNVWPATTVHPSHKAYPGSNINKCNTDEENLIFDACKIISAGESYNFTFNEIGTWRYHNHLDTGKTGTIIVN